MISQTKDIYFLERFLLIAKSSDTTTIEFKKKACQQLFNGLCLAVICFLQYFLATFDPIDSDLIINEQCINLSAIHGLPRVKNVILKSEFLENLRQKFYKKPMSDGISKRADKQRDAMFEEEVDKAIGKSQSISFKDLLRIRHIKRVIIAMVCITVNYMISRGMSAKV